MAQFLHHEVQLTQIHFRIENVNLFELGAVNQQSLGENKKAVNRRIR